MTCWYHLEVQKRQTWVTRYKYKLEFRAQDNSDHIKTSPSAPPLFSNSVLQQGLCLLSLGLQEASPGHSHLRVGHYPVLGTFLFKADLSVAAAAPGLCSYLLDFMGSHGSCSPCAHFTSQNLF